MGVGEQRKSSSANNPPPTPDSCASQSADAPKTIEEAAEEQLKSRQENPNNEGVSLSLKAKSDAEKLLVYDAIHAKAGEEVVATEGGVTATATFHYQCCPDNPNHFCERCQAKIHLMSERRVPRMPDSNVMRRLELQARMRKKLLQKRQLARATSATKRQPLPANTDESKRDDEGDEDGEKTDGCTESEDGGEEEEEEDDEDEYCYCCKCGRPADGYGEEEQSANSESEAPSSETSEPAAVAIQREPTPEWDIDQWVEYITSEDASKRTPQKQSGKTRRRAERRRKRQQQERGTTLERDDGITRGIIQDREDGDGPAQYDNSTVSSSATSVSSSSGSRAQRGDSIREKRNSVASLGEKRIAQVKPVGEASSIKRLDLTAAGGTPSLWGAIPSASSGAKTESSTTVSSSKVVHKPPLLGKRSDANKSAAAGKSWPKKIEGPVFPNLVLRKTKKPSPQLPAFLQPQMTPLSVASVSAPKVPTSSVHPWIVPMVIEKPDGRLLVLNSYEDAIALQSSQVPAGEQEEEVSPVLDAPVEEVRHDWHPESPESPERSAEAEAEPPLLHVPVNPFGAIGEETREARRRKRDQEQEAAFRAEAVDSTKSQGVQKWPANPSGVGNFDFASIKDLWTYTGEDGESDGAYLCGYRLPDFKF